MTDGLPGGPSYNRTVTDYPVRGEVRAWVAEQLEGHGAALTGTGERPHARPWSSAVWLGSTAGRVWFKANGRGTRHEPALLRLLGDRVPGLVPDVLGTSPERGWSLTHDAGPMLREALSPPESWRTWETVVGEYAGAQLRLRSERDAVLGAGVAEVSPASLPRQARELLDELVRLPVHDGGLGTGEARRLGAVLPRLDAWCAELDASPVPDTLQHDDLHSGNVCWGGSPVAARVIDWGDASWGCPLATLLCTLPSLDDAGDAAAVLRVRDAYLEPFTVHATRPELVHLVDLAAWVGCVTRALSWRAAMLDVPPAGHEEWGFPVRSWLLELLTR